MYVNRHVILSLHNLRAIGVYLRQPLVACSSYALETHAKAVDILLKQEKFSQKAHAFSAKRPHFSTSSARYLLSPNDSK